MYSCFVFIKQALSKIGVLEVSKHYTENVQKKTG